MLCKLLRKGQTLSARTHQAVRWTSAPEAYPSGRGLAACAPCRRRCCRTRNEPYCSALAAGFQSRLARRCQASIFGGAQQASRFTDANALANIFMYAATQQQPAQAEESWAAQLDVRSLEFFPPGVERPLISDVNLTLPAGSLGLIIGRSGSGKTTLLQVLAGLCQQDAGTIMLTRPGASGVPAAASSTGNGVPTHIPLDKPTAMEQRMQQRNGDKCSGKDGAVQSHETAAGGCVESQPSDHPGVVARASLQVGLVFQFPERHFLGEDIFQELTFAWPRTAQHMAERMELTARVQQVIKAVSLEEVPLSMPPVALSGGQQRRLALAIQLVRRPSLLLLDEPLAGLDWQARAEVVALLQRLKGRCTLLIVSHDMREVAPLVDRAWRMQLGGKLQPEPWPPGDMAELVRVGR